MARLRAAANRRHAEAEATVRFGNSVAVAAPPPSPRSRRRLGRSAHRALRARARRERHHDDRRARTELARTGRVDGRARGSISDAHRRGTVRGGGEHRRSEGAGRAARGRGARRRAGGVSVVEPPTGRWRSYGGCRWPSGSCRSRASSPTCRITGREHLRDLDGPVVFAANHQSHMDVPVILAALPGRWRARAAPAMQKEFFKAHFFPKDYGWRDRFKSTLLYYLAAFYFNAFPLPQREAGARQTLQYIGELTGDGWSIVIFPEGMRSGTGTHQAVPRRHRHDRLAPRSAGRPGSDRRRRSRAAPDVADGAAGTGTGDLRRADAAARRRLCCTRARRRECRDIVAFAYTHLLIHTYPIKDELIEVYPLLFADAKEVCS